MSEARLATRSLWIALTLLALAAGPALAIAPPPPDAADGMPTELSARILQVQPSLEQLSARSAWSRSDLQGFLALYSDRWEVRVDTRNDRPHLIQGVGIPLLPGRGNDLTPADVGLAEGRALTIADVERLVRDFLARSPELLRVADFDLRLDAESSHAYGAGQYLWLVELQQHHRGIPVEGADVFFRINHGNVVQLGADRVTEVDLDVEPSLTREAAFANAVGRLGIEAEVREWLDRGSLVIYPAMAVHEQIGERYAGPAGLGYRHLLVWRFELRLEGSEHTYRVLVDAHGGEVLEALDLTRYAQVQGDVYPVTNTDPLQTVGLPFTTVSNGGTQVTDASGDYTYQGGTATAELDGRYISINDNCGAISLSDSTTGDLDFGGSGGTDCTTPGFGGAGNTHSARSGYFHLTNINRKAATFFPGNGWLDGTLTANMNINDTCNAFWDGSTVNFYRSGGGCSNTGELAAVFLHEWGHGMDDNSGGSASENGSGEAVGDTFAFLETKDPCIGENFRPGVACNNCNPSCTGVRDVSAFAQGGSATIARPDTVESNTGIDCDRWSCPYFQFLIFFPYQGPMGYEGHCESYIASSANWDLAQSLVAEHGSSAGWARMDQIWYGSLTPSKSAYQVTSGGQCNPSAAVDGCGATNWYTVFLPADDDDGNLANGTPNACRIWDAFDAHGIACGSRPPCSGASNTAPSVTIGQPANGSSFDQGTSVSFSGSASDAEDGDLSANLSWSSDLDGNLGSGASFSTSGLSVGSHTITASVTDSGGLPGSDQISVTIDAVGGPQAVAEWGEVTVGGTAVSVSLANTFTSPVVVATVQYANNTTPVVPRISSVTGSGFDLRLQNPSGGTVAADDVSYLVVEEGQWSVGGATFEAWTYTSTVTDENNSWVGQAQSYGQSYTAPVVLGQVMSENDAAWSVFWNRGSSRTNPPSSSALVTGKTVCEDPSVTRADETIGVVVFEAGHGTLGGVEFEAALGADTVRGVTNSPPFAYTFNTAFSAAPTVALATMAGVDGGNGGWAYTYGSPMATATTLDLAIDEDQVGDTERNHTPEQVGYVVFATSGSVTQ